MVRARRLFLAEELERQFRRAADDIFDLIGILHAGQLDGDTVLALLLNGGFRCAKGIDAVFDNFQGLADGNCDLGIQALL